MPSVNLAELIQYGKTLKVLFIEDNEQVREQIHKLLSNFFSNIDIAIDGNDAIEKYNKYYKNNSLYYDIVISDLNLPKLDGIEVCSMMINKNPDQLILVISAHTESNKLMKLIEIGVYKFLQKPIQYDNFIKTISKVIRKKKDEKEAIKLKREISFIKDENQYLNQIATTDKLTQIYNRYHIDNVLNEQFNNEIFKEQLSIIFIDIDDFKKINDNYGHIIGDIVLREFSQLIKSNIRNNDILGRWGGEEFIVISTNTDIKTSILIAEKLKNIIEKNIFANNIHITSSFGIVNSKKDDTLNTLLSRADLKLYLSKSNGKNCISF